MISAYPSVCSLISPLWSQADNITILGHNNLFTHIHIFKKKIKVCHIKINCTLITYKMKFLSDFNI